MPVMDRKADTHPNPGRLSVRTSYINHGSATDGVVGLPFSTAVFGLHTVVVIVVIFSEFKKWILITTTIT